MHWLNENAPAVQASASVGIFFLTIVLVAATWRYAKLVGEELDVIRQQSARQQPRMFFDIQGGQWQLWANAKNVGDQNLTVTRLSFRLSNAKTGDIIVERTFPTRIFLRPGKAWRLSLDNGRGDNGLFRLPRRDIIQFLRGKRAPVQPSGALEAAVVFACGAESREIKKAYSVAVGMLGVRLAERSESLTSCTDEAPRS